MVRVYLLRLLRLPHLRHSCCALLRRHRWHMIKFSNCKIHRRIYCHSLSNILDFIWTLTLHLKKCLELQLVVGLRLIFEKCGLDLDRKIWQSAHLCWLPATSQQHQYPHLKGICLYQAGDFRNVWGNILGSEESWDFFGEIALFRDKTVG